MVCVPCIVIPVLLWVFHKYIQPFILKFWNPWGSKSIVESHGPPQGVDESDKQYQYVVTKTKAHPVVMFSKPTCSFCQMAREVLDGIGVEYCVDDIDKREDMDKLQEMFLKMTGQRTVPRVFVGGKCVGGGSEVWSLHNQGKLVPLLREAGATFTEQNKKEN